MKKRTRKRLMQSRRLLGVETLELRRMLDAAGLLWGVHERFSVSFVPDGTSVGPKDSQLFAKFEHLGEPEVWQDTILQGFQTWARHTDVDIASVGDDGSDIGTFGFSAGDGRFGDIRIAAVPLESDDLVTSIATNQRDGSTWVGDVFFNSDFDVETLDELFALALHEAGHIFGLGHSDDVGSPMHFHNATAISTLAVSDLEALSTLYITRQPDAFELASEDPHGKPPDGDVDPVGNDEGDGETKLTEQAIPLTFDQDSPGIPAMLFADVQSSTDVDFYELAGASASSTEVIVRLITDGVSQVRPTLSLRSSDGQLLGSSTYAERTESGQMLSLDGGQLDAIDRGAITIEVTSSADDAPHDAGGYTLIVADGLPAGPATDPDRLGECVEIAATTRDRSLSPSTLQSYLSSCSKNSIDSILAGFILGGNPVLGPEPVDPTESPFCAHDWLDRLFTCFVAGDIDGNGQVDFTDFLRLSSNFGRKDATRTDGDLNGDKTVDFSDFLVVSRQFGVPPVLEPLGSDPFGFEPFGDFEFQDDLEDGVDVLN